MSSPDLVMRTNGSLETGDGVPLGVDCHFRRSGVPGEISVMTGVEFVVDREALSLELGLNGPDEIRADDPRLVLPSGLQGVFPPEAAPRTVRSPVDDVFVPLNGDGHDDTAMATDKHSNSSDGEAGPIIIHWHKGSWRLTPDSVPLLMAQHFRWADQPGGESVFIGTEFVVDEEALAADLARDGSVKVGADERAIDLPECLQGFFPPGAVWEIPAPGEQGETAVVVQGNGRPRPACLAPDSHDSSSDGGVATPIVGATGAGVDPAPAANPKY